MGLNDQGNYSNDYTDGYIHGHLDSQYSDSGGGGISGAGIIGMIFILGIVNLLFSFFMYVCSKLFGWSHQETWDHLLLGLKYTSYPAMWDFYNNIAVDHLWLKLLFIIGSFIGLFIILFVVGYYSEAIRGRKLRLLSRMLFNLYLGVFTINIMILIGRFIIYFLRIAF